MPGREPCNVFGGCLFRRGWGKSPRSTEANEGWPVSPRQAGAGYPRVRFAGAFDEAPIGLAPPPFADELVRRHARATLRGEGKEPAGGL